MRAPEVVFLAGIPVQPSAQAMAPREDGLNQKKSVDQRKTFGTNRARHGATPEFTLSKTWEPPATGKPGAISHFCVQQPVNMT